MNKKVFLIGIVCFLIMGISGIYALTTSVYELNPFSTGIINIDVTDYTINASNNEELYVDGERVVDLGDEISLIPRISNLGDKCYIRAKITVISKWVDVEHFVQGMSSDWTKIGDYYYYTKPFDKGETSDLFEQVKIPDVVDWTLDESRIVLKVRAEAIQYKNFEPDFEAEDPWFGAVIEECIDKDYVLDDDILMAKLNVKYENGAEKSVRISEDFFQGEKKVFPGDELVEPVYIKNALGKKEAYYFRADFDTMDPEDVELLKGMVIGILDENGNVLYAGSLYACKDVRLGIFEPDGEANLTFKIYAPTDLANEYSLKNFYPTLVFYAVDVESGGNVDPIPDKPVNNTVNNTVNNIVNNTVENKTVNEVVTNTVKNEVPVVIEQGGKVIKEKETVVPKTGDEITMSLIIFFASAIGLLATIVIAYVGKRKEKNK